MRQAWKRSVLKLLRKSTLTTVSLLASLGFWLSYSVSEAQTERTGSDYDKANYSYLDHPCDPYYVGRDFPKLPAPAWVGDSEVDAVVVLAIDDMRDTAHYERFLRPIIDRLKKNDSAAGMSIMTNQVSPDDPQLQKWLSEGVTIDVHTIDHPCPCLQGGDLATAKSTYDRCVELMAKIPGNNPVAFRMPCCDSLNTPSPRFFAEVLHKRTPDGKFLQADSSVFMEYTPQDTSIPNHLILEANGESRFRKYLPFESFVNTITDYPYPYIIGRMSWQFPCMVPSDWEAQNLHRPNNPKTVEDWKAALDITVMKQGTMNLVFHPHNWIRSEQVVELIDYAEQKYGKRVKFLSFHEALSRINHNLLRDNPVRAQDGADNGVRLLDLNLDGFMDVVVGNEQAKLTRLWNPKTKSFQDTVSPFSTQKKGTFGESEFALARFGSLHETGVVALAKSTAAEEGVEVWSWSEAGWKRASSIETGLMSNDLVKQLSKRATLDWIQWRDLNHNGSSELLIFDPVTKRNGVYAMSSESSGLARIAELPDWVELFPGEGTDNGFRFIDFDNDGWDDVVLSNEEEFSAALYSPTANAWSVELRKGKRGEANAIPAISRNGTNNGAWFHSRHLWVQNEDTHRLPNLVDRLSFSDLVANVADRKNVSMPLPLEPKQALKTIRLENEQLRVEIVAHEPQTEDPVAFDWGLDGSLWVAEMSDYPLGVDGKGKPGGRVRILRDLDRDGFYEKSTLFLADVPYPNGIKVWRDGVLVMAVPDVLFLKDTNGDDVADVKEVLFRGFAQGNQQHRANGLRYGWNHRLYVANGDSGGEIESIKTGQRMSIRGRDLWIDPDTGAMGTTTGQTQFGRFRDRNGDWYGSNNANPFWRYELEDEFIQRNPYVRSTNAIEQVLREPGQGAVLPTSSLLQRFNDLHTANRFTSCCGPEFYQDLIWGDEYRDSVFVCEPVHNLVHRSKPEGDLRDFHRAISHAEFMTSSDNWFRPVMARTGPDGSVWVADMYRLVIEHPEWIPQDWQERLELRSGADRGRIYRIGLKPLREDLASLTELQESRGADLAAKLLSTNGWIRDMAQQKILWEQDQEAITELEKLLDARNPLPTRTQALWTLRACGKLTVPQAAAALQDRELRLQAIYASRELLRDSAELRSTIGQLASEADYRVALRANFMLGEFPAETAANAIATSLSLEDGRLRSAALSSINRENATAVFSSLAKSERKIELEVVDAVIASVLGFRGESEVAAVLEAALPKEESTSLASFIATLDVIRRRGFDVPEDYRAKIEQLVEKGRSILKEHQKQDRSLLLDQVRLWGVVGKLSDADVELLAELLAPEQDPVVRETALESLGKSNSVSVPKSLLAKWSSLLPSTRNQVFAQLVQRPSWARELVEGVRDGRLPVNQVSPAQIAALKNHTDLKVREGANALEAIKTTPRQELVDSWLAQPTPESDPVRGRQLFEKNCSACHKIGELGSPVGPDLLGLTDKSRKALVTAILDPNKAVEDKYLSVVVEKLDGQQIAGLVAQETSASITIYTADGKQIEIPRGDIETIGAHNTSFMPEGLEKQVDFQSVHDIIAFVVSNRPKSKEFRGNKPEVVVANLSGTFIAEARSAQIYGSTLVFEPLYGNLGWWTSADDLAIWTLEVKKGGRFEVELDYACDNGAAGGMFEIVVNGARVEGKVDGTGSWDNYKTIRVGEIDLPEGNIELTMQGVEELKSPLIDLRSIRVKRKN